MENSFDSLDRLMGFGMSLAVAQQMMQTMNHAISHMPLPGSGNPLQRTKPQYYVVVDNKPTGPLSEEEVNRLVATAVLVDDTLVWKTGATMWKRASELPEVNKMILLNKKQ